MSLLAAKVTEMSIYICRHADKESTRYDSMLSEEGHAQAFLLGQALAPAPNTSRYIMSSPYGRCLQTATAISGQGGPLILVEYGLSEGPSHVPGSIPPFSSVHSAFPRIDTTYDTTLFEPSGETSQRHVLQRCEPVARYISDLWESCGGGSEIVVVTHGTVAMGLVVAMVRVQGEHSASCALKTEGCCAAGYYKITRAPHTLHGPAWETDFTCHSGHIPNHKRTSGTTPICYLQRDELR